MAFKLFITPENVKETTSISGGTDNDIISQKIYYAQITDVQRILGQPLYDKFYADLLAETPLTPQYSVIFDKYIIDLHVFYSAYYFTIFNEAKSSNVGNTVLNPDRGQSYTKTDLLAESYKNLAISVENNFRKYMETANISEWEQCKPSEITNITSFY